MPPKRASSSEGYQQISTDDETESIYNQEPAGAVPGMPRPKKSRTPKQTKWWKILYMSLLADLTAPALIFFSSHGFRLSSINGPGSAFGAMETDTLDVVLLACVQ